MFHKNHSKNSVPNSTNSPGLTNLDSNQSSSSPDSTFNSPNKFRSGNFGNSRRPVAPLIKEKKQIPSQILKLMKVSRALTKSKEASNFKTSLANHLAK